VSSAPVLQSIVPLPAVPGRLRAAVVPVIARWGYTWQEVSFAGTAELPADEHRRSAPGSEEIWVLAITAGPLAVGDQIEAVTGRGQSLAVSRYSGGVIPVTPYVAFVYEYLGRHGGGDAGEHPAPPSVPTTPDMEPAAPDQLG
jgi:hypothetical protein